MKYIQAALFAFCLFVSIDASAETLYVPGGGDVQAAINQAQMGDTIMLEAGATFVGPFSLPRKPYVSGKEIVIRTSTPDEQLPPGTRVTPADASKLARLIASSGTSVLKTQGAARYYRIIGLEIAPAPGVEMLNVVLLGSWTDDGRWIETTVAELPYKITFDRVYIHGDPQKGSRRGIAMNGRSIYVYNSYISDFKQTCCDSQAIAGWNGPGPFRIENNYLEAAARTSCLEEAILPFLGSFLPISGYGRTICTSRLVGKRTIPHLKARIGSSRIYLS